MDTKPEKSRAAAQYPRDATETRARILRAARTHFARDSFDHVGVREIAADAGVDAALINRYFGSKEKLFAEVIAGAFRIETLLQGEAGALGMRFTSHILADQGGDEWRDDLDPLLLLLRSAPSPKASAIVAQVFHAEFVDPLANALEGEDTDLRAGLIASYIIGLATMRFLLDSPTLKGHDTSKTSALIAKAINACTDKAPSSYT